MSSRAKTQVWAHEAGFTLQKKVLVDDYAAVSSMNFDTRSFRLNFEVTVLAHDTRFCADVEAMLLSDLARSTRLTEADFARSRPLDVAEIGGSRSRSA